MNESPVWMDILRDCACQKCFHIIMVFQMHSPSEKKMFQVQMPRPKLHAFWQYFTFFSSALFALKCTQIIW